MKTDQTLSDSTLFDPLQHGFLLLPRHQPPGGMRFYEYRNHGRVDGAHDYHRLNLYLTQDSDYVTVWFGLLESAVLFDLFGEGVDPPGYDEPLFRGYIESNEQGRHILRALRPKNWKPQILRRDPEHGVTCEIMEKIHPTRKDDA